MYDIHTIRRVSIGRVGENSTREIEFDMSAWVKTLPAGTAYTLRFVRPTESMMYQPSILLDVSTSVLTWFVSSADTGIEGTGLAELMAVETETGAVKKSTIFQVVIEPSLTWETSPDVPDPLADWATRLSTLESKTANAVAAAESQAKWIVDLANDIIKTESLYAFEDEEGYVELQGLYSRENVSMPVGTYWMTESPVEDPAALFGGTWERVEGGMLMATGNGHDIAERGGKESVMLARNNLPEVLN